MKIQWIGKGIPHLKRKNKIRYSAFAVGDLKINVNDFVLVRNDDALDPEDVMTSYVAQVIDLFDTGEEPDPYQAQVKWFSKILELPEYAIKSFKGTGHDSEIVLDKRSSWHDIIDAETIFQKCEVLFQDLDCDYESVIANYYDHPFPVFFCRYVFNGISLTSIMHGKFRHIVNKSLNMPDFHDEETHMNGSVCHTEEKEHDIAMIERTNEGTFMNGSVRQSEEIGQKIEALTKNKSNKKTSNMYCTIPVGDSKYPKVVIKRIDDRILNGKNERARIFVADSNVDNVSDAFLEKLSLGKIECNSSTEKRPIIHTFSSQNEVSGQLEINNEIINNSAVESKIKMPKCRKNNNLEENRTTLSDLLSKKVFDRTTRSSPRKTSVIKNESECTTPQKIAKLDDFSLRRSGRKVKPVNYSESKNICDKNERVRIFVADSNVDNVSDAFLEKLSLGKNECNSSIEKRPIIHTFSSQNEVSGQLEIKKQIINNSNVEPKIIKTPKGKKNNILNENRTAVNDLLCKEVFDRTTRNSPRKTSAMKNEAECTTPQKIAKLDDFCRTRSGRKVKPVNYSERVSDMEHGKRETFSATAQSQKKMPHFVLSSCSDESDSSNFSASEENSSDDSSLSGVSLLEGAEISNLKKQQRLSKRNKSSAKRSSMRMSSSKKNAVSLFIPERKTPLKIPQNNLEESRQRLHASAVPDSLPCREEEYSDIYNFVKGCLHAKTGGCMYISGVPGTGKTATVHEVMRNLEEEKELGEVPIFTFVEVNGMWMTDPYQCYAQIFKALTGKNIAHQQAADLLEKRFTEPGPKKDAVVLLVDELDRLWTRKQTVMYNIFDWPTKKNSKLVVLAIANTMDLPERMMMNRISSRLGLTRRTFQPYTFKQLQEIITSRIQELKVFDPDAVQLVARKVAAVSGDARRALDICRFAAEIVKVGPSSKRGQKVLVGMEHVDIALQQMFASPVISAIRSLSKIAKLFFQCLLSEFNRSGLEETTLMKMHDEVVAVCRFEGLHPPNYSEISRLCTDLAASHLILVDNFKNDLFMKIRLNVSSDDVSYALSKH